MNKQIQFNKIFANGEQVLVLNKDNIIGKSVWESYNQEYEDLKQKLNEMKGVK